MTEESGSIDDIKERVTARVKADMPAICAAIRMLLTLQAAMTDGTQAQRDRIRKRMPALIEQLRETGQTASIYRLIREVHGPGWRPTGKAAEMIENFRGEG